MIVDYIDFSNNSNLYIITTDWTIVQEEMEKFNIENENCFDYLESVECDGVCFSILSSERADNTQIFLFGIQYGARHFTDILKEYGLNDKRIQF